MIGKSGYVIVTLSNDDKPLLYFSRTLVCPEPGCEEKFAKSADYFAHLNTHNVENL